MIIIIDNYDSFTYNLSQYITTLGMSVDVILHDRIDVASVLGRKPSGIVISPGPGLPDSAGVSLDLIAAAAGRVPILGVCLGHQAIAQHFGARIAPSPAIMHGKTSPIHHAGLGVFEGLPSPFTATRYHSMSVAPDSLPACLETTAWTMDDGATTPTIMGVRHRYWSVEGIQFHPEAILTEHGYAILGRFLQRLEKQ